MAQKEFNVIFFRVKIERWADVEEFLFDLCDVSSHNSDVTYRYFNIEVHIFDILPDGLVEDVAQGV